ncbi:MAG: hypothetical protein ACYCYI_03375 [Saccharofermentanales bacterium]
MGEIKDYTKILVGGVRWDGWLGDTQTYGGNLNVGQVIEKNLSPGSTALNPDGYHNRIPFFGKEIDSGTVLARQSSPEISLDDQQKIMDKEIVFAVNGGVDYWAFCWSLPGPSEGLDGPRLLFENSLIPEKKNLRYCGITGGLKQIYDPENGIISRFGREDYQKVQGGRPLLFILHGSKITTEDIAKIREESKPFNPFIVMMANCIPGIDAKSYYVGAAGTNDGLPYKELAIKEEALWDSDKNVIDSIIPIVTTGWDVRPRMEGFGFSCYDAKSSWTLPPSANELKAHIKAAFDWIGDNPGYSGADSILIYSWNEFDEGASCLCPSLYYGADILELLAEVKGMQNPVSGIMKKGRYDDLDLGIIYGGSPDMSNHWRLAGKDHDIHQSEIAGEYVKFAYDGKSAVVYGSGEADIFVDDIHCNYIKKINQDSRTVFDSEAYGILPGLHTVKIINRTTDGYGLVIEGIDIE